MEAVADKQKVHKAKVSPKMSIIDCNFGDNPLEIEWMRVKIAKFFDISPSVTIISPQMAITLPNVWVSARYRQNSNELSPLMAIIPLLPKSFGPHVRFISFKKGIQTKVRLNAFLISE